ncbi:MAG TPA: PBP1A family penicillin-binding protein [Beijerinckiaceae bacterium]|nr:PBP1A family penicillin-binding protein [Beijerinckiaceae bacterium]
MTRRSAGRRGSDDDYAEPAPRRAKRRRRSLLGGLVYWSFVLAVWGVVGVAGLIAYYAVQLPPIDQLAVPKRPPNIAILADDGSLLANRGDSGGPAIRLQDMPAYLPKAFIAIEDRRFYSHWGVDLTGIARAGFRNLFHRGGVEGGSTLTQQLAKNLFLTQERTLSRKIQEAILAVWLEHKYSKDQILELYLNRMYFGAGAFGVDAAARKYFGHGAQQVTLPEAAMLAGLMKAPTKLAPNRNPTAASERAAQVVTAMAQQGYVTEPMAALALAHPARAIHDPTGGSLNYAADQVMDALDETVGDIDEDIVVTTTIDPHIQLAAEQALTDELNQHGAKYGVSQGAVVVLGMGGEIKALVGGRNYAESQFNRAVSAKRQPGSSFKPFVYLTALEHGLTPDTVRDDAPINVRGWRPENAEHSFNGPVTLTRALALSLNTVAVRLALEFGPKAVIATAHRLGIASDIQPNASIALGTSEVSPLELVTAYTPFANGGIGVDSHVIVKVRTAAGKPLFQRKPSSIGRVIEPQYVSMMNTMMRQTLLIGTARQASVPGWEAAGKTGTSQDYRDAWFVGYTSYLVTGVWLGNDDSSPTRKTSGGNLPVAIWNRVMQAAHKAIPPQPLPAGVWHEPDSFIQPGQPPGDIPMASNDDPYASTQPTTLDTMRPLQPTPIHRNSNDLLPPAMIGQTRQAPQHQPNFFEKLFGG